jgi:hypothetical protein
MLEALASRTSAQMNNSIVHVTQSRRDAAIDLADIERRAGRDAQVARAIQRVTMDRFKKWLQPSRTVVMPTSATKSANMRHRTRSN